jgi:DNA polymerase-3 subunit alpha
MADKHHKDNQLGVVDMFGFAEPVASDEGDTGHYDVIPEWKEDMRLQYEKETLGLYLTGHPIEPYAEELKHLTTSRICDLKPAKGNRVVIAGLVLEIRVINSRRGKMAVVTLDDRSGRIEFALFSEAFERFRELLVRDNILVVEGEVINDEYSGGMRMNVQNIFDITQARESFAKRVSLRLDYQKAANGFTSHLSETLSPYREGGCPIQVEYHSPQAVAQLMFGEQWRIRPSEELLHQLRDMLGKENVRVLYK